MVSDNLVKIILEIEDKFSEQAKKADDLLKKFGDTASQSNNKAAQSALDVAQKYQSTSKSISGVAKAALDVGQNGSKAFKQWSDSSQKAIINFNRLDSESQEMLKYLSQMSDKGREAFLGMSSKAQEAVAKFDALQNETKSWGNTLDYTRSKMQLMGTNVDSLKGKIQVVGSSIKTHIGNSWDTTKNKVTVFGNYIKTHLSNALQTIHDKIASLGNAFSGLGGLIGSVFGGIGLAGMANMTIGASIARERIQSLSYATMGFGQSMEYFAGNAESLWNQMDNLTNSSLVSLDQLSQSASVVAMSTHANETQMRTLIPILNDIGQRAILMGKSGDEAMGLMQAAGKGLNGEFEMLRENFGISKEMLENAGWDGSAQDIDGYTKALEECIKQSGDINGMMNTTHGKLTRLQKMWSVSARSLGEDFKPYVDQALNSVLKFVDANNDGKVDAGAKGWMKYAAGAMTAASAFATLAPSITPVLQCLDLFWSKGRAVLTFLGLLQAEEGALTVSTLANTIATKANSIAQAARGVETAALTSEELALSAATAGVTAEEIGAAAAHSGRGAALIAESGAAVTATGANAGLTASLWAMTTALLANPITWVVVAVIALSVAVYEVGKAFGWWKDIPTLLAAVWSGIQRLWNAFINHPDVQAVISGLSTAWSWLVSAIGWVVQAVEKFFDIHINGEFDVVHTIIEGIGIAWQTITFPIRVVISVLQFLWSVFGSVSSAIQTAQSKFGSFGGFLATMASPILFVYECLKKIVCILLGCSPGIVPALQEVSETFTNVWNSIATFVSGVIATIVSYIQPLLDIFMQIVSFFVEMFLPAWDMLSNVLTIIWNNVTLLIEIFQAFLTGQINLLQMLAMIWTLIQTMFINILTLIINFVFGWAGQLVSSAINAASGFVNGIISWISSLPNRVYSFLIQVVARIISAGNQWVSNARNKAQAVVSGVMSFITQLPGKIYNEFMNIGNRMLQAGSDLVNKAKKIGEDIVNGLLDAMGIHSPGHIQEAVVTEFWNTVTQIKDIIKPAGEYAKQVGESIINKFGTPKLTLDTEDLQLTTDLDYDMSSTVDVSGLTGGLASAGGLTDETNLLIGESYDGLSTMVADSLNNILLTDLAVMSSIQSNDLATLNTISTTLNTSLLGMNNTVNYNLNQMVLTNKLAMISANNTTRTQLNSMLASTVKVTNEMKSAWSTMATSIISVAGNIKNQSTSYFNQLAKTIGNFYKKLQNPSQWGSAGSSTGKPSTVRHVGNPGSSGMKKFTNAIQNVRTSQMPTYLSYSEIKTNPFINNTDIGEYIQRGANQKVALSDLISYGAITIPLNDKNTGFGGWDSTVSPNVSKIKSTAREWSMKGPVIANKYSTGASFKVKEFENGSPKISYQTFKGMAEDVFSQCHYEFYYDSAKYGHWLPAFLSGGMNCSDSSDAIIAMAHACGLSASKVHGHWNNLGHYWAVVDGHKMDTTGWMNRRDWTPSASHAGPAPKRDPLGIGSVIDESLQEIFNTTPESQNTTNTIDKIVDELKLTINQVVDVNINGDTANIDENNLIQQIKDSIMGVFSDKQYAKMIVDKIAELLIQREKQLARMGGI